MRSAAGAVSTKGVVVSGVMRLGYLSPSTQYAASMMWHAMSPIAPVPKSHQPRQLNGA
jgi:hypothetical protein